jgi:sigma-B regulation protein RsbU (phosphoserine phosphatase)
VDLRSPGDSVVVNAGHEHPFLQRGGAGAVQLPLEAEVPFGMPFDTERRVQRLPLRAGDRLTLFSDGITEAQPDGGAMYGLEALAQLLDANRNAPPREAARLVTQAVRDHRAADLQDDATVVIVDLPEVAVP